MGNRITTVLDALQTAAQAVTAIKAVVRGKLALHPDVSPTVFLNPDRLERRAGEEWSIMVEISIITTAEGTEADEQVSAAIAALDAALMTAAVRVAAGGQVYLPTWQYLHNIKPGAGSLVGAVGELTVKVIGALTT